MFQFCCWDWYHLLIPCGTFPMSPGMLPAAVWILHSTCFPDFRRANFHPSFHSLISQLLFLGLSSCSSQRGGAPSAPLISVLLFHSTPIPCSPCPFQEELEKPRDTRCPPLSGFWDDRIIHLRKLQLGTVSGKRPD